VLDFDAEISLYSALFNPLGRGKIESSPTWFVSLAPTRACPVAMLGLEMAILGEKPWDLESERIKIDSDWVQRVLAIIERIEI
jgi:hypothetical protein